MKIKTIFLFSIFFIILTFTGCANRRQPISLSTTHFNTFITITLYDSGDTKLLDQCVDLLEYYDCLFSTTRTDSELYRINHSYEAGKPFPISQELESVILKGLEYTKKSKEAFSIFLYPLTRLWDFTDTTPTLPEPAELENALKKVSYKDFSLTPEGIIFHKDHMGLDLGAISKGYIADRIKDFLISKGVKSALINLGGNILCIGGKPDGRPFTIGVKKPFGSSSDILGTLSIKDKSVVSSGIYERCFTLEDKLYHHILDARTGYPITNPLAGVTIISPFSVDGDALSTTCLTLGIEKGLSYLESLPEVDGIFVDKEGNLHYTKNFFENYTFLPKE